MDAISFPHTTCYGAFIFLVLEDEISTNLLHPEDSASICSHCLQAKPSSLLSPKPSTCPLDQLFLFSLRDRCYFKWYCFFHFPFPLSITAAAAKSLQSCPTLCYPIDGSPPGSPVPGLLPARTLEWVAIFFSNAWKWKVKVKSLSCVRLVATPWTAAHQAPLSMGFSRQEYWSGLPSPSPYPLLVCRNTTDFSTLILYPS